MERPARLFLCARCRVQVVLCSRCDRGNRYCSRQCWRQAREASRRDAARRYQRSWRGRIAHAERSRRWRQRRARALDPGAPDAGAAHNVTHQGCRVPSASAPLLAWTEDAASSTTLLAGEVPPLPQQDLPSLAWRCRRCGSLQPSLVRLGFLRHSARLTPVPSWPVGRRHDHSP